VMCTRREWHRRLKHYALFSAARRVVEKERTAVVEQQAHATELITLNDERALRPRLCQLEVRRHRPAQTHERERRAGVARVARVVREMRASLENVRLQPRREPREDIGHERIHVVLASGRVEAGLQLRKLLGITTRDVA